MTLTPRESFELAGFRVADLSDEQLDHAAIVLVAAAGDELPTLQDIAIQLDEVRFRAKLTIVDEVKSPLGKSEPGGIPLPLAASSAFVTSNEFMPERTKAHPARGHKRGARLRAVHDDEDYRSGVIPTRATRDCDKCGASTTRFPYCRDCAALLALMKP